MTTPSDGLELAAWARMLADGTRATICLALLDGRAWTATELARLTKVSAPTISEHLLLVRGGLLSELRQGRHRYVRLAGPGTAELLENLAALQPRRAAAATSLSAASRRDAFARARTCYDHLAGRLGVAVTDAMTGAGLLDWTYDVTLTTAGSRWLSEQGIEVRPARGRPPVRSCLDVTERRHHIAGPVGTALCPHALAEGWVSRIPGGRALRLTEAGAGAFGASLGLVLDGA